MKRKYILLTLLSLVMATSFVENVEAMNNKKKNTSTNLIAIKRLVIMLKNKMPASNEQVDQLLRRLTTNGAHLKRFTTGHAKNALRLLFQNYHTQFQLKTIRYIIELAKKPSSPLTTIRIIFEQIKTYENKPNVQFSFANNPDLAKTIPNIYQNVTPTRKTGRKRKRIQKPNKYKPVQKKRKLNNKYKPKKNEPQFTLKPFPKIYTLKEINYDETNPLEYFDKIAEGNITKEDLLVLEEYDKNYIDPEIEEALAYEKGFFLK